jgi:outer membrane protein insertion porin family
MKRLIRHGGAWLLLLFFWLPAASGQTGFNNLKVAHVVITNIGPAVASEELIRANIRVRDGDAYSPRTVTDDINSLYATGFFANVNVLTDYTNQQFILTYVVTGKPRLSDITFEGNTKYSNAKLRKTVNSKPQEPVDEAKLFQDGLEIEKLYEKHGYPHTVVSNQLVNIDQAAGTAAVLFQITEPPKLRIVNVTFTGAHAFPQKTLAKQLKTKKRWMWSWITGRGTYKQDEFEEDQDTLAEYYRNAGYLDFEIKSIHTNYPSAKTMTLEFVVDEGLPYRVGTVTFKGNTNFTTAQLIQGIKDQHALYRPKAEIGPHGLEADEGMIFKLPALEHDAQAVEDFYGSQGYLEVNQRGGSGNGGLRIVQFPNTATGTMDLEYRLNEGQVYKIEKIEIRDNVKTKDRVIRRELSVAPGDVFDMVQVRLSRQRVEYLGFFAPDSVKAEPEDDPTLPPGQKNLVISVEEQPTGNVQFGAGFSTVESISAIVSVEQVNFDLFHPPYFTGGGQKMRLSLKLGTRIQDYELGFSEPWFLNRHLILDINLYRTVSDFNSPDSLYDEARTGASFALTKALFGNERLRGTISYGIEDVDIFHLNTNAPDAIIQDAPEALYSRFGTAVAYDTRNNVRLSNKGQLTRLSSQYTVGDRSSIKLDLTTAWYFKGLAEGHVLEVVGKAGVAQKIGSQDLPFYDRYYLGGQNDLRGFNYRYIGPRAVTQDGTSYEPIGGDTRWMGSVEYSIPIIEQLRFAVFYDIGNVSARPWSNTGFPVIGRTQDPVLGPAVGTTQSYPGNTAVFSDNYGFGLHLDIKQLPIRLDFGIPIHHDNFNSPAGKFQFGAGFYRPF